ncbi:dicarboxylate/amino acid:cation symporter, partial [Photobacterium damselae]
MKLKLFKSLPSQLLIAALVAWSMVQVLPISSEFVQSSWFQLIMMFKTTYIGLLKMVVGAVVL